MDMKTGVIILAAGSSSRLGQAKQLLKYQGKTLLQKAILEAKSSQANSLIVVLGSDPELIKTGFDSEKIPYVINPNWEQGMASSIQAGLSFLLEKEQLDQVLIMLCDQPFVDSNLLNQLIETQSQSSKGMVACSYSGTLGVPALYTQKYFKELLELNGAEGARKLFKKHSVDLSSIDFPEGSIDIDTPKDLDLLK